MSNITVWEESLQKGHKKLLSVYSGNAEVISQEVKAKALQELGFAYQIISESTMLQNCDPSSIRNAVTNIARTGITLNPVMRLAYLVPRNKKCILDFSYMGMISLLKNNGNIKTINAYIVYEDEEFEHDIVNNVIYHKPAYAKTEQEHNKRVPIGAYSVAKLPTNDVDYCFMPMWEINKIKNTSKGADSSYSPWNTWGDEMIKKTVIKRHFKMLISVNSFNDSKLSALIEIDNENNGLQDKYMIKNNSRSGLGSAFIQQEEKPSEDNIQQRVAMLVEEEAVEVTESIEVDSSAKPEKIEKKSTETMEKKKKIEDLFAEPPKE